MSNEKAKVTEHLTLEEGVREVIHRHGEAEKIFYPQKYEVEGTIVSPGRYRKIRPEEVVAALTVIEYNYEKGIIKLDLNHSDEHATVIVGKLVENPKIAEFGINKGGTKGLTDLSRLLKLNRIFFPDKEAHATLLMNLSKFKGSIQREIEKAFDDRGNKKELNEVTVTTEYPMNFKLQMPLFKGEPEKSFQVDICFDVRDGGISVWLESVELKELLDGSKKQIIDTELAAFTDIVCIETV